MALAVGLAMCALVDGWRQNNVGLDLCICYTKYSAKTEFVKEVAGFLRKEAAGFDFGDGVIAKAVEASRAAAGGAVVARGLDDLGFA